MSRCWATTALAPGALNTAQSDSVRTVPQRVTVCSDQSASGDVTLTADALAGSKARRDRARASGPMRTEVRLGRVRDPGTVPSSPNGTYYVEITLDGKEGAAAWLDAAAIEPDEAAGAMRCRRPLEASLSCDRPAHVFHQGQPVTLRAAAFNDGDHRRTVALVCRVTDFDRKAGLRGRRWN